VRSSHLLSRLAWILGLTVLLVYLSTSSIGRTTHGFIAYYAAGRLLTSGELSAKIYDDEWFGRYVQEITGTNVLEVFGPNTPLMALLGAPIAWLPPLDARTVWLLVSLAAFATSLAMILSAALPEHVRRYEAVLILLALLTPAAFANLRTGQAYLLVFAMFATACIALLRERQLIAGSLLGVLFTVKSAGAPLLVLLLIQRKLRSIVAATITATLLVLMLSPFVSFDTWTRYPSYVAEFVNRPTASVTAYQTTWSLFRRLCIADPVWNPAPAASCAPLASVAPPVLLVTALLITLYVVRKAPPPLWIAAGVCLSVIDVPLAVEQHFVTLLIPAILLIGWQAERRPIPWGWCSAFVMLLFVPLEYTQLRFTRGWSVLAAYPRLYAGIVLWIMILLEAAKHRESRHDHGHHV
jgi:hypothetical protein